MSGIRKGLDHICNICHKCEYRKTVLMFAQSQYDQEIIEKFDTKKSNWILRPVISPWKKSKLLMQADDNGLGHFLDIKN